MITGWTDANKEKFKSLYKNVLNLNPFDNDSDSSSGETLSTNFTETDDSMMHLDTGEPYTQYENRTKEQVYNLARELDISGRSSMNKDELIKAVREERS